MLATFFFYCFGSLQLLLVLEHYYTKYCDKINNTDLDIFIQVYLASSPEPIRKYFGFFTFDYFLRKELQNKLKKN